MRRLIATPILAVAALSASAMAPATATGDLAIRSITVKPANPVVGPTGSVKLVIEVVARGATSVSVALEPGRSANPANPANPSNPAAPSDQGEPETTPAGISGMVTPLSAPGVATPSAVPGNPAPALVAAEDPAPNLPAQAQSQAPIRPAQAPVLPALAQVSPAPSLPAPTPGFPAPAQGSPAPTADTVPAAGTGPAAAAALLGASSPDGSQGSSPGGSPALAPSTSSTSRPPLRGVRVSAPPVGGGSRGNEWETWRFLPEKALSRWYPSGPWTVTATAKDAAGGTVTARTTFFLKRATELEGVHAVRADDRVRITGTLLRVDPVGRVDYRPFPGQPVAICFRPGGSKVWRTVATAVTGKDGWFSARVRATGDGMWRAEYAGTGHYAPDTSSDRNP
ncbi:hypothetical protein N5079_21345 [Planotetraspora sp. A-T 1434]|uniref:hypothetical protein n=1 Tax=Planotetraspora sp. A-T 1434 TaxID=2979219 RepID=UPI0021C0C44C|nr:hypothetical protein [Planotetraspora sp. A-T 1434]MCT9932753.1 hypothetical protein [Planotetraspora sp. A-T 1434]